MNKYTEILEEHHPKSLNPDNNCLIVQYDNKQQFILDAYSMDQNNSQVSTFIKSIKNTPELDNNLVELIRNNVRNNLLKKGIITGEIYEGYKYEVDGLILDLAELATGNAHCFMNPIKKYNKYFYELYVNMSIPGHVSGKDITEGLIRLIETIKALEELNLEIKINVVDYGIGVVDKNKMNTNKRDILIIVPICSHTEYKDYNLLYPFFSEAMERGPLFQIAYRFNNTKNAGKVKKLNNVVNIWKLNEVELSERAIATSGLVR